MAEKPKYWFPAKRYGWGWGPPTAWQGWLVLIAFFALVLIGVIVILPNEGQVPFLLYTAGLVAVLLVICWLKGERPGWRWGGSKGGHRS
jgi:uncharacterized membrane protein YhaH (DUF805 family)